MSALDLGRWPAVAVFALAGLMAVLFAFASVNLFAQAMANVDFVKGFGWQAIRHGALWQVGELILWGGGSLACWLVFKLCEADLVARYQAWSTRDRPDTRNTERDG